MGCDTFSNVCSSFAGRGFILFSVHHLRHDWDRPDFHFEISVWSDLNLDLIVLFVLIISLIE